MATLIPENPPPTMATTREARAPPAEGVVACAAMVSAVPWLVPFMGASIRAARSRRRLPRGLIAVTAIDVTIQPTSTRSGHASDRTGHADPDPGAERSRLGGA